MNLTIIFRFVQTGYYSFYGPFEFFSIFSCPSSLKCIANKFGPAVAAIWVGLPPDWDKLFAQDISGFRCCGFVQQPAIPPVGQQPPTTNNRRQQRQPTNEATNNQQLWCSLCAVVRKLCLITKAGRPASKLTDKPATSEIFGCLLPSARCKWIAQSPGLSAKSRTNNAKLQVRGEFEDSSVGYKSSPNKECIFL